MTSKVKSKVYVIICDDEIKGVALNSKKNARNKMKNLIDIHYKECYLDKISKEIYRFMHKWETVETFVID